MTEVERVLNRLAIKLGELGVPVHLHDGLWHYVATGRPVGDFLEAVFSNNLFEAYNRADDNSLAGMQALVRVIYNYVPSRCWGSTKKYHAWIKDGGLCGIYAEPAPTA